MMNKFWRKTMLVRRGRRVLLYFESSTMTEHFADFVSLFSDDNRLKYFVCYNKKNFKNEEEFKRICREKMNLTSFISSEFAFLRPWDLVVSADLYLPRGINSSDCRTLFINHGTHIISYNGGNDAYTYSDRAYAANMSPLFSIMFEPNKRIAEYVTANIPGLSKAVKYVGHKNADSLLSLAKNKKMYRERLNVKDGEKLVMMIGSWNRYSLFHALGKELLAQAKGLMSKGYKFILTIHPIEYNRYRPDIEPLGKVIESARSEGFIVRSPSDDWMPYMIASDIVICDYSSLHESAILLNKKIIFSDFPDTICWKHSIARQIKPLLPRLKNATELEKALSEVENLNISETVYAYSKELYSGPGEYKNRCRGLVYDLLSLG